MGSHIMIMIVYGVTGAVPPPPSLRPLLGPWECDFRVQRVQIMQNEPQESSRKIEKIHVQEKYYDLRRRRIGS